MPTNLLSLLLFTALAAAPCGAQSTITAVTAEDTPPANISAGPSGTTKSTSAPEFNTLSQTETIAQTLLVAMDYDEAEKYRSVIEQGLVGHVLLQWGNYSLEETRHLTEKLQAWARKSPHGVPLLIYADYEGGTVFAPVTLGLADLPTNMMLGAAANPADTETLFHLAGLEMRRAGIHINFAPVLDVNTNPKNPIIGVRSFGGDPVKAAELGEAVITGLQSAEVGAVAKHFPGHGDTAVDSHLGLPVIREPQDSFFQTHLFPFQIAAESGVTGIMSAHILFSDIDPAKPATFSRTILTGLLRERMGFKGLIYSDSLDMQGALKIHSTAEGAAAAIMAGVDVAILGKGNPEKASQTISEALANPEFKSRLEDAAKRVYELKESMGLFKDDFNVDFNIDKAYETYACRLATQAITLVRGEATLDITGEGKKLCAVFFSPPRFGDKLAYFDMPFLNAGWQVTHYNAALTPTQKDMDFAEKCAQDADAVVFGSFQWAAAPYTSQVNAIEKLTPKDKPTAFLSLMSPYDINFYPLQKNMLALYGVSRFSASGAADILLGNIKPIGTMPVPLK